MKAMILKKQGQRLESMNVSVPSPKTNQVLLKINTCAVCRTDLHVVDGDLKHPKLPLIPGHEIIGKIMDKGSDVKQFSVGQRVGVPWLGHTCHDCYYCRHDHENLCDNAQFTGYDIDGGYAEYTVADADFCFAIPGQYTDEHAAPLMCAGLIGYRSLVMCGYAEKIGFYGFGAAAHILIQVARFQNRKVYAFTRSGDKKGQDFALHLGAEWAGGSNELPPEQLDAAIIFAPVGSLVPAALKAVRKAGTVVCAGIHMSDIPSFPYHILWEERQIKSVANLTRQDGDEFMAVASKFKIQTEVHPYPLLKANKALDDLRNGNFNGAAVLIP